MPVIERSAIERINDFNTLIAFLHDTLRWPVDPTYAIEDVTFEYTAEELRVKESHTSRLKDGIVRQLREMRPGQKWGIFFIEFADSQIYKTALRQILRGLVPNRRQSSTRKTWQHDNLLFICSTASYERFSFAMFRGDHKQTAKIATFGWQRGDRKTRTLCEYNLPALSWPDDDGANPDQWVKDWSKAFDKEPLTRDFFKRFDAAIDKVKADLEKHHPNFTSAEAYTRSQLLLERMIFLYFLQNRGWLDQERDYLLRKFEPHRNRPEEFSYYHDFLEKLFWSLASPPRSAGRLAGIPFLNGGLFDDDEFEQTPRRRKQNPPLKIRNATFADVFDDLLEAFNFTVREDTPVNQEVAVDPEMLGKVFESIVLHAEAADTDAVAPDKRKATGSYYTPRIVVHFICREVLRQYLMARLPGEQFVAHLKEVMEIDASDDLSKEEIERLRRLLTPHDAQKILPLVEKLKCCDPAVGSGAFPVGLLHELVNLRRVVKTAANGYVDPVRKDGREWLHQTKEEIVQNCLYGADVQQQAIEICQLRLWLSLVVDYDLGIDPFTASRDQFIGAIERISQLPNLEMNFRRGDSLYDHISGVPLIVHPIYAARYRSDFKFIHDKGEKLHKARKGEQKRKLRLEILERRLDISQRVLEEELKDWRREHSQLTDTLFVDETASKADRRNRIEEEIKRTEEALKRVAADRKKLDRLASRDFDSEFFRDLRRLEGANFDSPFNFAWQIDFADVFAPKKGRAISTMGGQFAFVNEVNRQQSFVEPSEEPGGFDIIVGNPPFVTARNPQKRELWRERWKRVCTGGDYQLVCPFFDLSFSVLLRPGGQLGFIVSNAFAKRDFGKPLVEKFFPNVNLQKIIDCSGLMFPGHGTPTAIILGSNQRPNLERPIRIIVTLPSGGDLRTPPEESPLWQAIAEHHADHGGSKESASSLHTSKDIGFHKQFENVRIAVGDCDRTKILSHPCNLLFVEWPVTSQIESKRAKSVLDFLERPIGFNFMTHQDEVYKQPQSLVRRLRLKAPEVRRCIPGAFVRDWSIIDEEMIISPYDANWELLGQKDGRLFDFLSLFKRDLSSRAAFGGGTYASRGINWYKYHQVDKRKSTAGKIVVLPEIATHSHFCVTANGFAWPQTVQVALLKSNSNEDHHLLAGFLNSSAALFWLKQVCFNKGAGEDEERDRFVYAGGKVQQLPVPELIASALEGKTNPLAEAMADLSRECWERGRELSTLALKKLFEMAGEAYHEWNSSLPGWVAPHEAIAKPFHSADQLRKILTRAIELREYLRAEMIARQEEMDWLAYQAYGLIKQADSLRQYRLSREHRPFVLWAEAEGDFDRAVDLIPADWPDEQKRLWRARLEIIRDNEHIRRIEQPVYKRRWDEQWKVGNRWQCGQSAYDQEFIDAFEWWLSEKAEWWLEKHSPASLDQWTVAVWGDDRVQAAWPVAAEAIHRLELWKREQKVKPTGRLPVLESSFAAFAKFFKATVKEQTVPEGIPFAVPYEKIKGGVSAQVKKIRGKLNVPRERFHITAEGFYRVAQPL
ncbi:MAG: hypothetical protein AB1631_12585 [Acidobacteriota bacterium]